ncbi:probable serine/threonine-protein kinase DDB_G0282963 isoform X2 [Cotesia glomerata]|nr:probable serine/threonine-protein kinase DDB_G0282963 isoform X2 [Cotesia glomerata]XP_044586953.1 probable serine/threonine-protein kinase DDB_G0282963 isoform X2 [Cotesia glomerata]XP_044586954.1 probable serine/threonine-protein kinase DDB_G0282963 isoform X2 [Cotesia glomerata]
MATIVEHQPWISKFKSMSLMEGFNSSLIYLMEYFIRNIRPTVNECQTKPLRADKLKGFISETLLFFMYYYRSHEEKYNRAIYMDLMSDLLAMYIDLELKASKRTCEYHERISGRLASYLYIYLENSTEYLLDTILKVRFMSSTFYQIINPIMTTIFRTVPKHPISCLMYTRYFLVYRIWKRITKDQNIKNEINAKALASLKLPTTSFPQYIIDHVLPKVPNIHQEISTKFMLSQHMELEKSSAAFIKFCRKSRGLKDYGNIEKTRLNNTTEILKPEDNLNASLNLSKGNSIKNNYLLFSNSNDSNNSSENNNNSESKVTVNNDNNIEEDNSLINIINPVNININSRKVIKKSNVVLIDLTLDDTNGKIIKQKKQDHKRLSWLQKISKRKNTATIQDTSITEDTRTTKEDSLRQLEDILGIKSFTVDLDKRVKTKKKLEMTILSSPETSQDNSITPIEVERNEEDIKDDIISSELSSVKINTVNFETNESLCTDNITLESSESIDGYEKQLIKNSDIIVEENDNLSSPTIVDDNKDYEQVLTTSNVSSVPNNVIDATKCNTNVSDNEYLVIKYRENENNKSVDEKKIIGQSNLKLQSTNLDVNEHQRNTVLHFNQTEEFVDFKNRDKKNEEKGERKKDKLNGKVELKISDAEFHENIDGLSLLASVSQRVSHLTTISNEPTKSPKLIKVKDYNSLLTLCDINKQENNIHDSNYNSDMLLSNEDNRFVSTYPDDDIDKVAFHVEVSSTEDYSFSFPKSEYQEASSSSPLSSSSISYSYKNNNNNSNCSNERSNGLTSTSVQVESTMPSDKEETNVILNGETIVLLQKSPNSNLYIINKAVENREHTINNNDDEKTLKEKNSGKVDKIKNDSYSRELYDPYRISQPLSSAGSKSFELAQEIHRTTKAEPVSEAKALDLKKAGKNKNSCSDIKGVSANGRRRIKQEFNSCTNDLTSHINNSSYAQDHDPHIHLPGSNPLSTLYHHSNYATGDLYISCRQNCNSVCVPVNHQTAAAIHSNKKSTRCTCLNCTYDIVTHCNQYMMPAGEMVTETTSAMDSAYYIPLQQSPVIQDCSLNTTHDDNQIKIYDGQLLCKIEADIDNEQKQQQPQSKQPQPQQQTKIYSPDINIQLPLKKRFKSIITTDFEATTIKVEKDDNTFMNINRSIISMEGTLETNSNDNNLIKRKINSNNIIERNYDKNLINDSYHDYSDKRKRKHQTNNNIIIYSDNNDEYDEDSNDNNYKKINDGIMRPLKKLKEPKSSMKSINSVRKTRSSQRKVPKINYSCMDDDVEVNPSVETKRKKRKTSR